MASQRPKLSFDSTRLDFGVSITLGEINKLLLKLREQYGHTVAIHAVQVLSKTWKNTTKQDDLAGVFFDFHRKNLKPARLKRSSKKSLKHSR